MGGQWCFQKTWVITQKSSISHGIPPYELLIREVFKQHRLLSLPLVTYHNNTVRHSGWRLHTLWLQDIYRKRESGDNWEASSLLTNSHSAGKCCAGCHRGKPPTVLPSAGPCVLSHWPCQAMWPLAQQWCDCSRMTTAFSLEVGSTSQE